MGDARLTIVREGTDGDEGDVDPCKTDPQLVCLGLLFGLGEFGHSGTDVLGSLVRTGAGVIGLFVLMVVLGTMGAAALTASDRVALAPRRAD